MVGFAPEVCIPSSRCNGRHPAEVGTSSTLKMKISESTLVVPAPGCFLMSHVQFPRTPAPAPTPSSSGCPELDGFFVGVSGESGQGAHPKDVRLSQYETPQVRIARSAFLGPLSREEALGGGCTHHTASRATKYEYKISACLTGLVQRGFLDPAASSCINRVSPYRVIPYRRLNFSRRLVLVTYHRTIPNRFICNRIMSHAELYQAGKCHTEKYEPYCTGRSLVPAVWFL